MNKNQTLIVKYPEFFEWVKNNNPNSPKYSIDLFGIECNDGWYELLDNLMDSIKGYCSSNNKPYINVTQIKEKFGGLRFYYTGGDELIAGMVWFAEDISLKTCEYCGKPGVLRTDRSWYVTSCDTCNNGGE